jgi:N-acetylglutamate synthase-like GNAT family acetyltransferase
MEACRAPLTVDPEAIAKYPFYVLDEGGTITGFYGLSGQPPRGEIEFLFVEPESVRSGRGQRLARHFLALARSLGFAEMDVSADAFAENFYVAMGAVRIAEVPSDAIPNRLIPRLRFSLLADRVSARHLSDLHTAHPGEKMATIPMIPVGTVTTLNRSILLTERGMSGSEGDDFIYSHCGSIMLENFDPSTIRGNPVYQCGFCENNNDLPFTASGRRSVSG